MTSKEFIIDKLTWLVTEVSDIKCSYTYDEVCSSHNIEILPSERYHNSEIIKRRQFDILDEFYKTFPDDIVVFFTEDDFIEIDVQPDFVIEGLHYKKDEKSSWIDFVSAVDDKFDIGIKGVTGDVNYENNYALAA